MALGGGTYTVQNKILGGAYFKVQSVPVATALLSDRGIVGMGVDLNWGVDSSVFTVESADFLRDSISIFGYDYSADEMQNIRELSLHCKTMLLYRLNSGGTKATNTYATAKYNGTRGNDLKIVIQVNVDDENKYDVYTYLDANMIDKQTVASASDLVNNDFVVYKTTATLSVTAGTALTGGTNGTSNTASHQAFLNKIESYPEVNVIGYAGTDDTVKGLYVAFAKRMRDEIGIPLQAVVYNKSADSEAVISVKNSADLVYWVTGVQGGTACNKSCTNMIYDGELTVSTDYLQSELESAIKSGEFTLHRVGDEVRVLQDINSFVSITDEKGAVFQDNQTIRVLATRDKAIASVFASKYLGKVPNDKSGRESLWMDCVKIHQDLQDIRAIENFDSKDLSVEQGVDKHSVLFTNAFTVVNTMTKLYSDTTIA